jgi:hypothetical protein
VPFIDGDFLDIRRRGSNILPETIYVFLHVLFTFFVLSGRVGVRSLNIMMMGTDEFRDVRLREDRNSVMSANEIAFEPVS